MMTTVAWCNKPHRRNQKRFPTTYSTLKNILDYPEYFKIFSNAF